jgi:hypothetical protein
MTGRKPAGGETVNVAKGGGVTMIVKVAIGIVLGGLAGFAMYRFIGCASGACPITANPWTSTIFGMIIGGSLSGSV